MNVLVIDVGTSSMRGILLDEKGQELAQRQYFYGVTYMENSWVEQNSSDWENALYDILKEVAAIAKERSYEINAVAITAQRSSVIPVDKSIRPLSNAIMWQDKRTNDICHELEKYNDRIFELCGSRVNPVFSASKMTWFREECPEIYEKTYKFMVIPDYLIYIMTGSICTDYTYGSRSLLMNIKTHEWDDELLELFRVDREKLCDLVEPGSVCGTLTKKIAELTGCPEGIPVITSGGDQQCGAIGQGVVKEGILSVTAGTGGFLVAAVNEVPKNLTQNVICNYSSVKNQFILESSVITCCSAFDWFRVNFYEDWSYKRVDRDVEKTPIGSNGCICVPYFQGRSTPDWNNAAKGMFSNITLNTKKGDILRSLLEGICYEIDNGIEVMKDYVELSDIYINGGLTNSEPFNEIQCNVYGRKLIRKGKADATVKGALLIALTSLGVYKDAEQAFSVIGQSTDVKVYLPKEENVILYKKCRAEMNDLYQKVWNKNENGGI